MIANVGVKVREGDEMSYEVRRVPKDWEHPKKDGLYVPMYGHFPYFGDDISAGLQEGWLVNEPPNYGRDVMPQWPTSERTHFQMYENKTEGTPVSPVMETPEEIARYLVDSGRLLEASPEEAYYSWLRYIVQDLPRLDAGAVSKLIALKKEQALMVEKQQEDLVHLLLGVAPQRLREWLEESGDRIVKDVFEYGRASRKYRRDDLYDGFTEIAEFADMFAELGEVWQNVVLIEIDWDGYWLEVTCTAL